MVWPLAATPRLGASAQIVHTSARPDRSRLGRGLGGQRGQCLPVSSTSSPSRRRRLTRGLNPPRGRGWQVSPQRSRCDLQLAGPALKTRASLARGPRDRFEGVLDNRRASVHRVMGGLRIRRRLGASRAAQRVYAFIGRLTIPSHTCSGHRPWLARAVLGNARGQLRDSPRSGEPVIAG
jgi:hypothetical protein